MPEERNFPEEVQAFIEGAPLPEIERGHLDAVHNDPELISKLLTALKEERQWVAYYTKAAQDARTKLEGIKMTAAMERPMLYQDGPLNGVFDAFAPKVGAGNQAAKHPHAE